MKKDTPEHYKGANGLDTIALIKERNGIQASINFCLDNALKYATRLWRKESPVDDARKIVIYTNRAYNDFLEELECLDEGVFEDYGIDQNLYRNIVWNDINYISNQLGVEEVISYLQGTIIANTKHISIEEDGYNAVWNQLFLLTILSASLLGYVKNVLNEGHVKEEVNIPHGKEKEENDDDVFDRTMTQINDGAVALANNIMKIVNDSFK